MTYNRKGMLLAAVALSLSLGAGAQGNTLQDGIKMVNYERYNTARNILQPLAASSALANYYLGLAELGADNKEAARAIFSKYPDDAANMAGMARYYFAAGDSANGMRMVQAAADKAKKKDVDPLLYAGNAITYSLEYGLNPASALPYYAKAQERTTIVPLLISIGDTYRYINGGGGKAMDSYDAAVAMDPNNSFAWSRKGDLRYAASNYDSALANFRRAKDLDPNNPLPYLSLARAYSRSGNIALANENVDRYYELSDKTTNDKVLRANIKYLAKQYDTAIAIGRELLSAGYNKPSVYRLLAYGYYEKKDYTAASEALNNFLRTEDPKKVTSADYLYQGRIALQSRDYAGSEAAFQKAFNADTSVSNKLKSYREVAEAYGLMRNDTAYGYAGNWYARYAAESPAPKNIDYFNWGKFAYGAKNYAEAGKAFKIMQEKYPTEPVAFYWGGLVAYVGEDPKATSGAALPHFNQFLTLAKEPKKEELMNVYSYMASYYYNKKDKANAIKYSDMILQLDPASTFGTQMKKAAATLK